MKKLLSGMIVFFLIISMTACSGNKSETTGFDKFSATIDTDYSKELMMRLSEFGDDPVTGNRSAGSPAEHEAAEFLMGEMENIGLSNVTKDTAAVDGWTFKGANLTYQDAAGKEKKINLGGYATNLVVKEEPAQLVYVGKGTAADYEGVDVTNKLALIDIDQNEEWWINYPAYQAKLKGAKAVIAMSIMPEKNKERIGSQDICGPADAPAYGISQKDSLALREMIEASGNKEIPVVFNSDSTIDPNGESYNLWGEIKGKSDQVIYLIGHYDGYYHSEFDNASGISTSLGIAKAILDSGYTPEKTIRIVAHGAEEFGKSGNQYDWATGAYEQIMTNHPEWAETAFAVINIDGGYPVEGEKNFAIHTSHELYNFTIKSAEPAINSDYTFDFTAPAGTGTEDFGWTKAGIPSIVAGDNEEGIYYGGKYHSDTDSMESAGFNDDVFLMNHRLYGKILLDLDRLAVRPMDFETRFQSMEESIDADVIDDAELTKLIGQAKTASATLNKKIADVNESGTVDKASDMNLKLFHLYKQVQDDFLRLDCNDEVIFPHEQYQVNVDNITAGIAKLKEGDVAAAYDEHLSSVDFAWYATAFDEETCDYFTNQLFQNRTGTWGDNMVQNPVCDIDGVIRSLGDKYDEENPDVTGEIKALQDLLKIQQGYLDTAVKQEKVALKNAINVIKSF